MQRRITNQWKYLGFSPGVGINQLGELHFAPRISVIKMGGAYWRITTLHSSLYRFKTKTKTKTKTKDWEIKWFVQ